MVKTLTKRLATIQNQIILGGNNENLRAQETLAQHELEQALANEEMFWLENFKVRCPLKGVEEFTSTTRLLK